MKGRVPILIIGALALAACVFAALRMRSPDPPPPPAAAPELTAFEKDVLLELDALKDRPEAAPFLKALDSSPGLRAALSGKPDRDSVIRFKTLVREHQGDAGFREAVRGAGEPPAAEEPCDAAPAAAQPKETSLLEGSPDDVCPAGGKKDLLNPL